MKNGDKSLEGFVQVRPGVWHRDPPGDDPLHFTQVDVATILKDRRKQVGMTMEQLAEKIGVNKSTISRLEARKTKIKKPRINGAYSVAD